MGRVGATARANPQAAESTVCRLGSVMAVSPGGVGVGVNSRRGILVVLGKALALIGAGFAAGAGGVAEPLGAADSTSFLLTLRPGSVGRKLNSGDMGDTGCVVLAGCDGRAGGAGDFSVGMSVGGGASSGVVSSGIAGFLVAGSGIADFGADGFGADGTRAGDVGSGIVGSGIVGSGIVGIGVVGLGGIGACGVSAAPATIGGATRPGIVMPPGGAGCRGAGTGIDSAGMGGTIGGAARIGAGGVDGIDTNPVWTDCGDGVGRVGGMTGMGVAAFGSVGLGGTDGAAKAAGTATGRGNVGTGIGSAMAERTARMAMMLALPRINPIAGQRQCVP